MPAGAAELAPSAGRGGGSFFFGGGAGGSFGGGESFDGGRAFGSGAASGFGKPGGGPGVVSGSSLRAFGGSDCAPFFRDAALSGVGRGTAG